MICQTGNENHMGHFIARAYFDSKGNVNYQVSFQPHDAWPKSISKVIDTGIIDVLTRFSTFNDFEIALTGRLERAMQNHG